MALQLSDESPYEYDNLEVQTVHVKHEFPTDEVTGEIDSALLPNSASFDIAGGLSRDEIAELVQVRVGATAVVFGATETVDAFAQFWGELSTEPKMLNEAELSGTNTDPEGDASSITNPEVIDVIQMAASASFEDSTSGVGGGGDPGEYTEVINYREAFDSGPTFDRHNDLWVHTEPTNYDAQDAEFYVEYDIQLIWAIHDRD